MTNIVEILTKRNKEFSESNVGYKSTLELIVQAADDSKLTDKQFRDRVKKIAEISLKENYIE